jgi:DNA-binding response OmpR family regulator
MFKNIRVQERIQELEQKLHEHNYDFERHSLSTMTQTLMELLMKHEREIFARFKALEDYLGIEYTKQDKAIYLKKK